MKIIRWLPQLDFRIQQRINNQAQFFNLSLLSSSPPFSNVQDLHRKKERKQRSSFSSLEEKEEEKAVEMCLCLLLFFLSSHFCMAKNNKNNYQLRSRTCMRMVCVCVFLSALVYLFILWSPLESVSLSERLASCVCVCIFFLFVWFRYVSCEKNAAGIGKENKKKLKGPILKMMMVKILNNWVCVCLWVSERARPVNILWARHLWLYIFLWSQTL